ncbi:G-type lectin S-receptor-like serine/threonine-protein kinase SD2-5 [Pyrus x bretschneideri]|uniref:G-type lectin S-receptor-like serine/threonine-protein kinase SD2-5 n=1 Tax=Pyrus x bretschneideri TaxID=225117 RepID=UPI002030431B|nr:G-type lectin S-receptor-like serine/threonine-protein kinase SD2-5 [Pyrus x bretschneideri]
MPTNGNVCRVSLSTYAYSNAYKGMRLQLPNLVLIEAICRAIEGKLLRTSQIFKGYKDLQTATNNYSLTLGQGGFGSVYQGSLPDGTQLAVKKLEGVGQGKKEFGAEVSIIGNIHHLHLALLRGFCAEGSHRLLVYDYMANGSLDNRIFKKNNGEFILDWETRFNIHCCDIKPENVLLDTSYLAKVSDFGLAKLMTREQSHVFPKLRETHGYLAPESITNCPISEKSDVCSYGMLLLEIIGGRIGGRKNYDPTETSENFPSYAFKMLEEGKMRDILDTKLGKDEADTRVHIHYGCSVVHTGRYVFETINDEGCPNA